MAMCKFKGAVSDLAETFRRLFADPPCHQLDTALEECHSHGLAPLEVCPRAMEHFDHLALGNENLVFNPNLGLDPLTITARLQEESSFAAWASGAQVLEMEVFKSTRSKHAAVPPLPRRAQVRQSTPETFHSRAHTGLEGLLRPRSFAIAPSMARPRIRQALDLALGLPIAFMGRDPSQLPKPLWMRYTLQIVKATGENIRNLDVLGIYRIPTKGVVAIRHDARAGRLMVQLGSAAAEASRRPFMLAMRKDDRSIVSCYLEGD